MHQSGHCRAQSMHTVQLSSTSEMTPRERAVIASRSRGYWTVCAPSSMVMNVVFKPFNNPTGVRTARSRDSGISGMDGHLGDAGDEDVRQRQGNEELPSECLELILSETRKGEPDPEDQERDRHDLRKQDEGTDHLPEPRELAPVRSKSREPPAAEEQRRRQAGESEGGREFGDEEEEEPEAGVLGHE